MGRVFARFSVFHSSVVLCTTIGVLSVYGANNSLVGRMAFSACFNYSLNCNFRNSWHCSEAVPVEISTFRACRLFGACRHVVNKICVRTQKTNACRRSGGWSAEGLSGGVFSMLQKNRFSPPLPRLYVYSFRLFCSVRVSCSYYRRICI